MTIVVKTARVSSHRFRQKTYTLYVHIQWTNAYDHCFVVIQTVFFFFLSLTLRFFGPLCRCLFWKAYSQSFRKSTNENVHRFRRSVGTRVQCSKRFAAAQVETHTRLGYYRAHVRINLDSENKTKNVCTSNTASSVGLTLNNYCSLSRTNFRFLVKRVHYVPITYTCIE